MAISRLLGVLIAVAGFCSSPPRTAKLTFPSGKSIQVDLALTSTEREMGLMYRTELPPDYGMLFVFAVQGRHSFWMKNTWTSLDMIFIDREKRITEIFRNVPRSYPETPEASVAVRSAEGQYVLELPSGAAARYRLKKGDRLNFAYGIDKK